MFLKNFLIDSEQITDISLARRIIESQEAQLNQLEKLEARVLLQAEQIVQLKEEILRLKGEKGRPDIKPSTLNKSRPDVGSDNQRPRGKPKRKKTSLLKIHEEKVVEPPHVPVGSRFKGYQDWVVQELEINLKNTCYKRARYLTPDGRLLIGELPPEVSGSHFGAELRSYILSQYYQQHVTQNLILRNVRELGIEISSGELNEIITGDKHVFHTEKEEVLKVGLQISSHINVDDTGARHQGRNGYCTHIGNEFFTYFSSTESKSRVNFLKLLRADTAECVLDDVAREYMKRQRMPNEQLKLFMQDRTFPDDASWDQYLAELGLKERCRRIATEGVLVATLVVHNSMDKLVIVSDDAGQFNVAGFLNALCWVHAERTINKINSYADKDHQAVDLVRKQIWEFYQELKSYKANPDAMMKDVLVRRFDKIFSQKTCFQTLNLALQRLYANKEELLLVLKRPEIPLHNNLSENDIRDYVKRRKISSTTRSDSGRNARDTMLSLKKTCQKLGISFREYIFDRISMKNLIPPLPTLIMSAATAKL